MFRGLFHAARALLSRHRVEQELEKELRFHLEMEAEQNMRKGMGSNEARRVALIHFGSVMKAKEECREVRSLWFLENLWQDLRYCIRVLLKNPGFAAVAVLSLGLGIGANTAIYSLIHAVLLNPLPMENLDKLVQLSTRASSYPLYTDLRDGNRSLSGLAAYSVEVFSMNADGRADLIPGSFVSGNYFDVLGIRPVRGRAFLPEEDHTHATHPVAVISYGLWKRVYNGADDVIGKTVTLNNQPLSIVGVTPQGFRGTSLTRSPEVWVPIHMMTPLATGELLRLRPEMRGWGWLGLIGRLKDGVSPEEARADLSVLAANARAAYPEDMPRAFPVEPTPLNIAATGLRNRADIIRFVSILASVVCIALLIACANVANLLLSRASQRGKEISLRLALGANRRRIIQQLLVESIVLALLGGALGILVAVGAMNSLAAFELPGQISIKQLGLGLNWQVLAFTLLASVITGVAFGLVPALQASKGDLISVIKGQSSIGSYGRAGVRNTFVVIQAALCLVLLIGAGLFVKSLQTALATDLGFEPKKLAFVTVNLGMQRYTEEGAENFCHNALERIQSLPGVESASWTTSPQLAPVSPYMLTVSYEGYEPPNGESLECEINFASQEYFRTLGIGLVRGRGFTDTDAKGAPAVAIVNETLAKKYFADADPIGRTVQVGERRQWTIIGIARDSKYGGINEEPRPYIYTPLNQNMSYAGLESLTLLVRTAGDPAPMLNQVTAQFKAMDSNLPLSNVRTMSEHVGATVMAQRFGSTLLGLFGILALVLASTGIYGIVSYSVTQRTKEIGIRMALGARRSDILKLIISKSMALVLIGAAVGIVLAAILSRMASRFLFGVETTDPLVFAAAAAILAAAALLASYLPARRATRIDPILPLRSE